jgi:glycogen debranching enzyme
MVEVQAYAVAAKEAASRIAAVLGETAQAKRLAEQSAALAAKFNDSFWCEQIGTYALALDGMKRQCAVRSSNAGHALLCGVATREKADGVARNIMSREGFSGWGVRTVAAGQSRYNPMAYHNGTVWPHDCSLIAAGLGRYGFGDDGGRILSGLFDAVCQLPEFRMPELFCGFPRRAGEGPVRFPSACTPQAWASGSVFLLLQACLGIDIDARAKVVTVRRPHLPDWLEAVTVRELSIGGTRASLHFNRSSAGVEVSLLDNSGGARLVTSDLAAGEIRSMTGASLMTNNH